VGEGRPLTGAQQPITIACQPAGDGWQCHVTVGPAGDRSEHEVSLSRATLESLAPDADGPDELLEASFRFLLAREPREAILRTFALTEIARYFPEYESEIGRRR
jgi:hypothetical protein